MEDRVAQRSENATQIGNIHETEQDKKVQEWYIQLFIYKYKHVHIYIQG